MHTVAEVVLTERNLPQISRATPHLHRKSLHRKEYNMELQEIRNEIDRLDKQIQSLFEERMLLCQDVARYKKHTTCRFFRQDGNSRSSTA